MAKNKVDNLTKILEKHQKWSCGEKGGERANLSRADLSWAKNLDMSKWLPDLYILKEQPPNTKLFAYKFLDANFVSPLFNFKYKKGKTYTADELNERRQYYS